MKVEVPGMMCANCVKRISDAFAAENVPVEISLEEKTIDVAETDLDKAKELLDDLGF